MNLSDAELLRLVREGGDPSFAALNELEQRHFHAVRIFATMSSVGSPAAAQLAYQSWEEALRHLVDGSAAGAIRPCVLSSVLRTASGWMRSGQRFSLHPDLAAWIDANGPVMLGNTATAGFRRPSLVARAFAGLPHRRQTILWHQRVERDDCALTGRLISTGPGEVNVLTGRIQGELFHSYIQILQDGMPYECSRFQSLVPAYADARSADIAAVLTPHLERCPRCSQAVADLTRLRHDCGTLLAESVLPWGGPEYAARGIDAGPTRELFAPRAGIPAAPQNRSLPPAVHTPEILPPDPHVTAGHGVHRPAAGRGRHASLNASGAGARAKGKRRADLVVRGTAVAGVCAVAAAFAFVGDFDKDGEPQSKEQATPPAEAPPPASKSPSPSRTKASPTGGSTASKTKSRPPKPSPTRTRPSPPSQSDVGNAAVAWLFNSVDGDGVTPDSSDNDKDGTLFGASRPTSVEGDALAFDGTQFVASSGPLVDTGSSFSVSARVKLDRTDVSQTVVSQDASDSSGFQLQYDADDSRWEMRIPEEDTDDADGDADEAVSLSDAEAGEWTQLTGVYDDAADEVRLYVDGRLGETAEREQDFGSDGRFVVGRGLSDNEFFQGLQGTVDNVKAFGRALTSAEARALARES
ncbi:LamG domain-containing protein [Streptomyces winkii]|uniref:LamG domain-containing protein n=1 Tax=Streptomyces winkii TaxID=3051178 RepID=UPI0028D20C54|nr:LamG domain-containing protein [Streptomyces sp. DSM 40971]